MKTNKNNCEIHGFGAEFVHSNDTIRAVSKLFNCQIRSSGISSKIYITNYIINYLEFIHI